MAKESLKSFLEAKYTGVLELLNAGKLDEAVDADLKVNMMEAQGIRDGIFASHRTDPADVPAIEKPALRKQLDELGKKGMSVKLMTTEVKDMGKEELAAAVKEYEAWVKERRSLVINTILPAMDANFTQEDKDYELENNLKAWFK